MITIYFVVVVDTRTPWLPNPMTAGHKISAMANTQWRHWKSSYFQQKSANFGAMPH